MKFIPQLHHELATEHLFSSFKAALWMGMGLGKTACTLAAYKQLLLEKKARGMLVVAPLRVCVLTWPNEVKKWDEFSHLRVANLRTKSGWQQMEEKKADIYVINWDMLPQLCRRYLHGRRATDMAFDLVVFDEITRAKNHESKRVNELRAYITKFSRRWGLTGTPAPNSLLELFAQFRLLDDGQRLGVSYAAYRDAFFDQADKYGYSYRIRPGSESTIHSKVADIALVLKSSDWLNIPDTVVEDIEVPLPDDVKPFYKELADELFAMTDKGDEVIAINAGVLVNKLLQVCGGAVYLAQEYDENYKELPKEVAVLHDAKLKALQALVKKLHPEPVMIACQYRHEQTRIKQALPSALRSDECRTEASIRHLETSWNAGRISQLIVNPQSVGHGLNLQEGGRTIIWYSYHYSRELYDQMNGRLARTGQARVPYVYRLICPGTMDDAVIATLEEKGEVQNALLEAVKNFRQLYLCK